MSSDLAGSVGLWFVTVLAAVLVLPVIVVGGTACWLGRSLVRLAHGQALSEAGQVKQELRRINSERNAAIRDIVRLRNEGERELRRAAAEQRAVGRGRRAG